MIQERGLIKFSEESLGLVIPIDLVRYMELKAGDTVCIHDEVGKKGIYLSVWKKE